MTDALSLHRIVRRHEALAALRRFFAARDFVEVDTPILVPGPGLEPHIDPLAVRVRASMEGEAETRWLITSPELALKRVLALGVPCVLQLCHVFRDGERTARHLPEFMLLEWYRAGAVLDDLVTDCEGLFDAVGLRVPRPYTRTSVAALWTEHAGIDLRAALVQMADGDTDALPRVVRAAGHHLRPAADFEDAFFHVMTEVIEPRIGRERPVVVSRWPRQMAVLARLCSDDPLFAERFEIYAGGLELANAFLELTDPIEQRARFVDDNTARARLGKPVLPLDEEFLAALAHMPSAAGIAVGVDRLLMLCFGASSIDDVTALPWR